jgi:hypothetical protein
LAGPSPLPPEENVTAAMRFFDASENHEWISIAALLMVLQPYRARCPRSENDSMARFGLPQASDSQTAGHIDKLQVARLKNVKAFRPWHWFRTGILRTE